MVQHNQDEEQNDDDRCETYPQNHEQHIDITARKSSRKGSARDQEIYYSALGGNVDLGEKKSDSFVDKVMRKIHK